MFITLPGELSWQRLRRSVVDFYSKKTKKSLFEPPFRALRGNVCTSSIGRWKASGRLPIRHNWTFFRYLLRLRRFKRKSVEVGIFKGAGSLWAQISDGGGRRPPTTVGVRKLEWLPFCAVSKYPQCIVWVYHKAHVWQTDGRTDGQNYDS